MSNPQGLNSPATPGGTVRSLRRNKEVFYKVVWPGLAAEGWTKIDASESMNGKPIFVPKVDPTVMGLREGQKGEDFYDDEKAVVARLLERRNEVESAIADSFLAKVSTPSRAAKGEAKIHREAPRSDGATKQVVPKTASIRGTEEASRMINDTKDDSKSDRVAETAGEAALKSILVEREEEASPMATDPHDEPVDDVMETPGESITPANKEEASQMAVDTHGEPVSDAVEPPGESTTPARKEEACQMAIDTHTEPENDVMETPREPSTPVEKTEASQMAIDTHDEPVNDPKSDYAKETSGGSSTPEEKEDASQMVIDTHDEPENDAKSDGITESAGEAVLNSTAVEKEAATTTIHTRAEPAEDAKSDSIAETAGDEEKAISPSQILEEPGPGRATLENEQAIGDEVGDGKTTGEEEEELVERVTEPKKELTMQEASQQLEEAGQHKYGSSSAKEAEKAGSAKKAGQDKGEESSKDSELADSAKKAGPDEDSSAKDLEEASPAKKAFPHEESPAKDSAEASPAKKSSHDEGGESSAKDSDETTPAKRERRRPQRSAVKNKKEKEKNMGGRRGEAMETVDRVAREGKSACDVSDCDGSDYHSSDESEQGRKRKRRAAPASPPGRGRGRGRPRGRPRRKPKAAPSPKRGATPPRGRKPRQPSIILDGWKDGGKNFPKKISQVGPDFNVTSIEPAGSWKDGESKIYCEQIWDPVIAEERVKGESIDFLAERGVPHNKREAAMVGFAEVGYDAERFDNEKILDKVTTKDGSEWTEEERQKYHTELFRLRKDVRAVSKSTGKSMNSCFAYYLGTFKKSDDYRLLKSVCYQERLRRLMDAEHDPDACAVCGDGGNLLICDGCEGNIT